MKRVNYLTLLFWISLFVVLISKNTFASSSNRIYNDSLFETSDSIKVINDSITKINFENLKILQSDYLESGNSRYTLAGYLPVSYTHLRAHETVLDLVCRLLLEKKNEIILHK